MNCSPSWLLFFPLLSSSPLTKSFKVGMQPVLWKTMPPILRNPLLPPSHFAARFHSTPALLAKWKPSGNHKDDGRTHKPSKNQIRISVRQKRADAKKALKDFLLYGKSSKLYPQDEGPNWCPDEHRDRHAKRKNSSYDFDDPPRSKDSSNSKSKPHNNSGKGKCNGKKRGQSKRWFHGEDDCVPPETVYEATFGGQRCYTWSFTADNFQFNFNNPASGFSWRDESWKERSQNRVWSESDVDDDTVDVGSYSQRIALGLPPTGPITLDEVKCAFRASALKWHPDKHQGSSQAKAEEKFKLCAEAYNSLCSALKSI